MKESHYIFLEILLSFAVCCILIYLFYYKTKFGFQNGYLYISGVPIPIATAITCILIPLWCGYSLHEYFKTKYEIK